MGQVWIESKGFVSETAGREGPSLQIKEKCQTFFQMESGKRPAKTKA